MPKTRTAAGVKVTVTAPLLPVALATAQPEAAALCIIAAALQAMEDQEKAHGTPAET